MEEKESVRRGIFSDAIRLAKCISKDISITSTREKTNFKEVLGGEGRNILKSDSKTRSTFFHYLTYF